MTKKNKPQSKEGETAKNEIDVQSEYLVKKPEITNEDLQAWEEQSGVAKDALEQEEEGRREQEQPAVSAAREEAMSEAEAIEVLADAVQGDEDEELGGPDEEAVEGQDDTEEAEEDLSWLDEEDDQVGDKSAEIQDDDEQEDGGDEDSDRLPIMSFDQRERAQQQEVSGEQSEKEASVVAGQDNEETEVTADDLFSEDEELGGPDEEAVEGQSDTEEVEEDDQVGDESAEIQDDEGEEVDVDWLDDDEQEDEGEGGDQQSSRIGSGSAAVSALAAGAGIEAATGQSQGRDISAGSGEDEPRGAGEEQSSRSGVDSRSMPQERDHILDSPESQEQELAQDIDSDSVPIAEEGDRRELDRAGRVERFLRSTIDQSPMLRTLKPRLKRESASILVVAPVVWGYLAVKTPVWAAKAGWRATKRIARDSWFGIRWAKNEIVAFSRKLIGLDEESFGETPVANKELLKERKAQDEDRQKTAEQKQKEKEEAQERYKKHVSDIESSDAPKKDTLPKVESLTREQREAFAFFQLTPEEATWGAFVERYRQRYRDAESPARLKRILNNYDIIKKVYGRK